MSVRTIRIPARGGTALDMAKGQRFRIVDVEGQQVSDVVAFAAEDHAERFSPGNTRKLNGAIKISRGGMLYSTRCRPLLRIVEDTVGEHDLLFSSCSAYDYRVRFGLTEPHASCLSILSDVLAPRGIDEAMIPDPFTVFQRSLIGADVRLTTDAPRSKACDYIEVVAEADCLVVLTACPQDMNPCNGYRITDIDVVLL